MASVVGDARKKLEFRKLLVRVSDELGQENVKALKNLCFDIVGGKKMEEIDSGIDLFNILIEKGSISADKPHLLSELLEEVGRTDLSATVQEYIYKKNTNTLAPAAVVDKLEFRHIKMISEEVGRDWKMLGRHLGLDEATLDSINQAHFHDLKEASFQMLLSWQKNAREPTPQILKQALIEMKLNAIVQKYLNAV